MTQNNPDFLSTMSTNPTVRLADGADNIHSLIFAQLNIATSDNRVIDGFNITQNTSGTYTTYAVSLGSIFRDGLLKAFTATSSNLTVEIAQKNFDWYGVLVITSADPNAFAIRTGASSGSTAKVSVLTAGDIPIAIIKFTAGQLGVENQIQYLAYGQTVRELSIVNEASGVPSETLRITKEGTVIKSGNTGIISFPSVGGTNRTLAVTNDAYVHPNHSGDVTSSADGATTIAADAVTYAKMQNVSATNRILGRDSSGAGIVEEITPANLRTMINVEDGATADQTDAQIETAYNNQVAVVSTSEKNAGTSTAIKRFTPADIHSMIDTHAAFSNTDVNVSIANLKTKLNSDFGGTLTIGSQSDDLTFFTGGVQIQGNLLVNGTTTTINTETVALHDNIVVLNSNSANTPSEDAGVEVERGNSANVQILWDESAGRWTFTNDGSSYFNIPITSELANPYVHPDSDVTNLDTSGAEVLDTLVTNATGHITAMTKRTLTKANLGLGNVENTAISSFAGTTNITTVGTIGTGTWNATPIATAKIADDAITQAKLGDDAVGAAQLASNAVINASVASNAAIAQSKIDGLSTSLSGKEPSLTIGLGLNRTSATLALDINSLTNENAIHRTNDTLAFYDADGNTTKLRKITIENILNKLTAADIPADAITGAKIADDAVAAEHIASNAIVNASVASNAAITADKLVDESGTSSSTKKIFTYAEQQKLAGIAASANNFALTNGAVSNAHLAGSIANAKLSNSSVTVNSNAVALGASITLDTGDIGEGSNKYYTDERVDDRVNTLITAGEGIDTSYNDSSNALTISAEDATTSNKGVASFATADFEVSSGAVGIKASGVSNSQLAGSIAQSKVTNLVSNLAAKSPIADPTFTGEIGIGGVNVSETELGILEGATLTTAELNYVDGVTSSIQTQLNTKLSTLSVSGLSDVDSFIQSIEASSGTRTIPSARAVFNLVQTASNITRLYEVDFATGGHSDNISLVLSSNQGDTNAVSFSASDGITITKSANNQELVILNSNDVDMITAAAFSEGVLTLTQKDSSTLTATVPDVTTSAHGLMTDTQFDQLAANVSKLSGIEASADVTDTANVTSAGALMDSELSDLAGVKGVTISTLQVKPSEGAFANGDKTKLDSIEASATADQTASEITALLNDVASYTLGTNSGTITVGDDLTVTGDLIVSGTTTTLNTDTLEVEDLNITVGKAATSSSAANGAGLTFGAWSSGTIPTLIWSNPNTRLEVNKSLYSSGGFVGDGSLLTAINGSQITSGTVASARIANLSTSKITSGTFATSRIANNAITYAKMQNVSATDRILGRDSSGAGVIEEITPANLRTMINVADGATSVSTEDIQDIVGGMFSGNTETNITAEYADGGVGAGKINLVAASNLDTSGNAGTATALATARTIGGTSFDGTANIAVALSATTTALATARTIGGVSFDGTANITLVSGSIPNNAADTSGNAATATALATARTIGGVSFDGSANINLVSGSIPDNAADTSGEAATATKITSITNSNIVQLTTEQTLTNKTLTAPNLGTPTAINLTNATSPPTWNQSTTGSAATLTTARTIGGTSFNGSANIAVALAATATTLATARAINGVNFDGSAPITVTAAATTLTGTTLKSTVVGSSLTSVGTLTALQVDDININDSTISSTNTNGDVTITPHGTGDIVLDGVKWPQADGNANYVLKTDGSGQLSWGTATSAAGGLALSNDANNRIVTATGSTGLNGESNLTFDGSTLGVTGDLTVSNDLTVSGDISVSGNMTYVNSMTYTASSPNAFVFEGTTANEFETTLTVTNPTADRTITLPNAGGTVAVSASAGVALSAAGDITANLSASHIPNLATSKITSGTFADARIAESNVTQHLAVGTGLDLSGKTFSVDVSDFMANGANNRILTATGTDAINSEASLTYDGTNLYVQSATPRIYLSDTDNSSGSNDGNSLLITKSGTTSFLYDRQASSTLRLGAENAQPVTITGSKMGIGTTGPQSPLHVVGNVMITSTDNDNAVKDSRILGRTYTNNDYNLIYGYADASTNRVYLGGGTGTGEPATDIIFHTLALNADTDASGTERMRILANGNIGIGTASPAFPLEVNGFISTASGIVHTGDTNNTITFGTDTQSFNTAGSTRMFVKSDGKIGIGDTNPLALLHIEFGGGDTTTFANTNETFRNMILLRNNTVTTNAFAGIAFDVSTESDFDSIGASIAAVRDTSASDAAANHDANLVFSTNDAGDDGNTERMRITHDGLVGIGTTTPSTKLHVKGAGVQKIIVESTDNEAALELSSDSSGPWIINSGNGSNDLRWYGNGAVRMQLTSDGKLGIGTASPAELLDVNGNTKVTGNVILAADNNQLILGAGSDLKIYHDGSNSYIDEEGTGSLIINSSQVAIKGGADAAENMATFVDNGAVTLYHNNAAKFATTATGVSVTGTLAATSKSFVIPHPTKKGKTLEHGSLEGPENGVYIRGRLEGDVIELPDYWLGLVDEDTITVQLTPNKGFQQIYVDNIEDNKVYLGTQTDAPIDCFYFIQAERKDIGKMVVEY